ncbi:MAG: acetyl-CoA C-acyltransferase [Paracoccaceae bacterium]
MSEPIVISAFARTPVGSFMGQLAGFKATELGSVAVRATLQRAGVDPAKIEQIVMGCVLSAGLGQAPARQAGLGAGLPDSVAATTVNKMCGSGLQAVMLAADIIAAGSASLIVAGGMESMSNAPYLLAKHRAGARIGHDRVIDSLYLDGLEDAYEPGKLMGAFAEEAVLEYRFSRQDQDAFALESLNRARAAQTTGSFAAEIAAVGAFDADETPLRAKPERIATLKPAFAANGTITAANSSSISDGAAALLIARASTAQALNLPVAARIVAHATHAHAPRLFTTAPVPAIRKLLAMAGWTVDDVDLFEVNEAFAAVAMIAAQDLCIPRAKLNVNGGACALGHPIGASGARILVTLLAALQARDLKRGVAALCIGGGEAVALAVERD